MSAAPSPDDRWAFDPATCRRLAHHFGTPLFAYRPARVLAQVARLRAVLPPRVRLAYAVKANPGAPLLEALAAAGLCFDVASAGELQRVLATGTPGSRIFFAGPGKSSAELEQAVAAGVRVQAEGLEDLERLAALAPKRAGPLAVNLRIQPRARAEGAKMGGLLGGHGPTAFGVDEEDLPELLAALRQWPTLRVAGVHGFVASNELDAAALLAHAAAMVEIADHVAAELGASLDVIDLGGGLGIPYRPESQPLDLELLGRGLAELLEGRGALRPHFGGELILEPGRFLAAPCGVYLVEVVRVKRSRGETFAILRGGINHLLRPLLTGEAFPVSCLTPRPGPREPITLAGPLCTALDRLGRVELPSLQPGDLLAFGLVGAYGETEAMVDFLDHARARSVWLDETEVQRLQAARAG